MTTAGSNTPVPEIAACRTGPCGGEAIPVPARSPAWEEPLAGQDGEDEAEGEEDTVEDGLELADIGEGGCGGTEIVAGWVPCEDSDSAAAVRDSEVARSDRLLLLAQVPRHVCVVVYSY